MSNASGDDEELKGLLDDYEHQASAYGQGRRNSTTKAREALESLFGRIRQERDRAREEAEEMDDNDVLQVLCRVFEDGADKAIYEWFEWYKPEEWLHSARALGAFISTRLESERAELGRIREAALTPEESTSLDEYLRGIVSPKWEDRQFVANIRAKLRFISGGALKEGATQ